jgi:MFS family permease
MAEKQAGRALLHNRDFVLLASGQVVSFVGTQAQSLAVTLIVLALTHSASSVTLVLVLSTISTLSVGLVAGALVDRWNRKRAMIVTDAARALVTLTLPIAIWVHHLTLVQICVVVIVSGAMATLFNAANASALPNLVDRADLPQAMSRYQASLTTVRVIGATLSGLLYGLGHAVPFVANAASFAVSATSLRAIRGEFQEAEVGSRGRLGADIGEGLRYLRSHSTLLSLTLLEAADNLRFSGGYLSIVVIAKEVGSSPLEIGVVFSTAAIGSLLGSLLATTMHRLLPLGRISILMIWSEAISFPVYALCHSTAAVAGVALFESVIDPMFTIGVGTFTAKTTPDSLRGRVAASTQLLIGGVAPIGLLLAGVLITAFGARTTAVIFGGWLVFVAVVASSSHRIRAASIDTTERGSRDA